ncbi:putative Hemerythrin [Candidatus Terasakiella magnetica]|uniref:Putative Hemerythrin n=1 Tax=Candidatus Terasakiella magnetica TaxID=1867952 RepID=A0A1C3RFX0_9PROT|nr:bacteriohemerythrin [Candidatus Terasakiella magnetica]SCA56112.1 putative Hemerythrin [Candidatus Terasakiella magnetica]
MSFKWQESMSVGISVVDDDHKKLIAMIEQFRGLVDTLNEKSEKEAAIELDQVFYLLHDFTKTHFRREEMIMKALKYPDVKRHVVLHQELIKQLMTAYGKFKEERTKGNLQGPINELATLLNQWIVNHILQEDLQLKRMKKPTA